MAPCRTARELTRYRVDSRVPDKFMAVPRALPTARRVGKLACARARVLPTRWPYFRHDEKLSVEAIANTVPCDHLAVAPSCLSVMFVLCLGFGEIVLSNLVVNKYLLVVYG